MLCRILLLVLLLPAAGLAQVPTDTVPRPVDPGDTLRVEIPPGAVVRDTLPADTGRSDPDSLMPAPHIPRYPAPERPSWAAARWEWDRPALQRFNALSLLELLERVPGIAVTSAGGFGHPAGVTAMGQGGGRLRVFRDGLELDPLNLSTYDLQQIGTLDLDRVTVERTLIETRVHLRTFQLADRRPFSELEIGTGNYQARFLRAVMARPVASRSVVTASYDLASASGYFYAEPFSFTSGRLRWDYSLSSATGLQLEFLQSGVRRESGTYPADFDRRELVLRGRSELRPDLTVEALIGQTAHRPAGFDRDSLGAPIGVGATVDTLDVQRSTIQGSLRAMWTREAGYLEAGARFRTEEQRGYHGPLLDLTARGGTQALGIVAVEAEARSATRAGNTGTEILFSARSAPLLGFSIFGNVSLGERWLQTRRDTTVFVSETLVDEQGVESSRERAVREVRFFDVAADVGGLRVGMEWASGWARLGAAAISSNSSLVVPFGAGFDHALPPLHAGDVQGLEGYASFSAPFIPGLRLDAWYTRWSDEPADRPYLPTEQFRASVVYHDVRRGGQFEPTARLDAIHRGSSRVPEPAMDGYTSSAPYTLLNFHLQLRIIDVRAFFTYQNLLNEREAFDIPGRLLPGPRTMYGVRWFFRN